MPIYEYRREDGSIIEAIQKFSDPPLTNCPETGQKVERIISESSFQLKGSGWYKTDYAGASTAKASSKSESKATESSSEGACGSPACATACQGASSS